MSKNNGATLLLFVLALAIAAAAHQQPQHDSATAAAAAEHAGRRSNKDDAAAAGATHLHFYFHDTVSGKSPTAVRVLDPPPAASPQTMFGMVNVMDDPLTEGPEQESNAVGRAQGLYMGSDQARLGLLQAMNLVFTSGEYNGSTLALLGRNCPLDAVRELPVLGGTGAFRFARGYALLRTHWFDLHTGDATVEYNVFVKH